MHPESVPVSKLSHKGAKQYFSSLKIFLFEQAVEPEIDLVQKTRHKIWNASLSLWISWV